MILQLLLIILIILIIPCNFVAMGEKEEANVKTEFMGSHIHLNYFTLNNRGVNTHANINNYFFYTGTTKEYYYEKMRSYNETVAMELLCCGTNLPVNHSLTWHVLAGSQEIATVTRNSSKPNSNFTLYYNLGIYDNATRFYCSVELSDANIVNSGDFYVHMSYILEKGDLEIAFCNVSRGFPTLRDRCKWNIDAVGYVRLLPASDVRDVDYAEGFDFIVPEYYNSFFSTVTHNCFEGDTTLIKQPNGTTAITNKESFTLTQSDNGTMLFCVRFNRTIESENGSTSLTTVIRDTYNERICLYNENILFEDKIKTSIVITMGILFIVLVVLINILGFILCIYRRVKHRGEKSQNRNTDDHADIDIMQHVNDIWKKLRRT